MVAKKTMVGDASLLPSREETLLKFYHSNKRDTHSYKFYDTSPTPPYLSKAH
jgi:hypothetical protein